MKGLLLKDFYMTVKYCKLYLVIMVLFAALSSAYENLQFLFTIYPCFLAGVIPMTLLSYDERSKWLEYSGTLPYTKTQIVSGKYLMGLIMQIAMLILSGIVQAIRLGKSGIFDLGANLIFLFLVLILCSVANSFYLPFMFKWGVEKGRIAYMVILAVIVFVNTSLSNVIGGDLQTKVLSIGGILPIIIIAGIAVYALSWGLSIVFYKKREV